MPIIDHQQLTESKIDALRQQWELLNEKLNELEKRKILETRVDEKLHLKTLIKETESERARVEQELKVLEKSLSEHDSDAEEVAGRNNDQGPIELTKELSTHNQTGIWKKLEIIIKKLEIIIALIVVISGPAGQIIAKLVGCFPPKPLEISSATYNLRTNELIITSTIDTSKIGKPQRLRFWVTPDDACTGGASWEIDNKTFRYKAECDLTNIAQKTATVSYPDPFYSDSHAIQPITEDGR